MRHRLFLAVLLSLALGLLKETTAATGGEESKASTTVPTTSKNPESNDQTVATPAPSVNTTSEPPGSNNQTVATSTPSVNTTSAPPESNDQTVATPAPSVNTTSEPPGSNNQTVATSTPSVNTTSEPPGSNNQTVATSTPSVNTTSTPPENFCSTEPCGRNFAKCVPLKSSYTCQCEFGFYYSKEDKNCYKGDVYPGLISVNEYYNESVQIVNSTEYEEVFNHVSEFFQKALASLPGYVETVIVEIKPQKEIRADSQTDITVINLFKENSDVTNQSVSDAVMKAITESPSYVSSYKVVKKCDVFQCDTRTTECVEEPVLECKCKNGLGKINQDDRFCLVCSESCFAEVNKYCKIQNGIPACTCMTNFEYRNGKCAACRVGYSGENCTDNTELILIIVGTVLGAVILTLVIAVTIISARTKDKQNSEKKRLIKSGYSNTDISDDRPTLMFPRVQTTSGHANPGYQSNNPYEMPSTDRGHFSETGFDDLYEPSQERGGFRTQSRY
ncbi:mucin-13 isoform X3 [Myiozetetes cayanensis]|uniref:mucin-13 isoform X3 n=1 Tax=Myiozetetes cayanensis TaxID=478635 RepID=UPI00215E167A|nr:mucin-13 isoform X3 [Myiozetetes cayanensis]